MSAAIFIDTDGKVKLRVKLEGGTPPDISITKAVSGATFIDDDGDVKVLLYADGSDIVVASGNAQASDVLAPKTFSNSTGSGTGTMVDHRGASPQQATYQPGIPEEVRIVIPTGYWEENNPIFPLFVLETNLVEAKIPVGVTMFGITGSYTSDANAVAADMLASKTAYVNGAKVTGAMPDHTAQTPVQTTYQGDGNGNKINVVVPEGYYKAGDPTYPIFVFNGEFHVGNIKAGATVFGITGTFTADATATAEDIKTGKTAYVNGVLITGTAP